MKRKQRPLLPAIALIAYCALLVRLVVFKAIPTIHIGHRIYRLAGTRTGPGNFVPFRTIGRFLNGHGNHLMAMVNLLGNILPFVPIGLLAPLVFRSMRWSSALLLGIGCGLACEVMEAVFRVGIFDVDDILLNATGVVLGFALAVAFQRGAHAR